MSTIRFGTCSWKYESWKGIIYPESEKFNYLKEYSNHFNTVEIDQWFWSLFAPSKVVLPNKKIVNEYKNSVTKDFLFTIKVPNSITLTHFYRKNKSEKLIINPHFLSFDLFNQFLDSIEPLLDQLGCLIFQFEYLNKEKMKSQAQFQNLFYDFWDKVSGASIPIGIEIRNPNYLNKNYFEFLERLKIIPVMLEGYFMPSVIETMQKHISHLKGNIVFRLHGPDRAGIEKLSNENWNQIYIDRISELEKLVELFKDLLHRKLDLFINVNNHFEGSAPITINRIKKLMQIEN
ncbi:MAG: DUF72 domain-containing protein [Ignavibacteriaceae bacterium]|nr:DUF72 domain-containing protein [Ignavibacteriaceae bacterium]HRN27434.1 DUF72 domain-containing protein [Ignavibacteriaceae bacterium]HRP93239.1 DUF72 domain-containing protein [Ignavibacteriaceae bacterium]HRQ55150.1 DUF72 domain-containing protein [Ignavibacteriaceae bacterium]